VSSVDTIRRNDAGGVEAWGAFEGAGV